MTPMRRVLLAVTVSSIVVMAASAAFAQPATCDEEARRLRLLVQTYAQGRTEAEFAWAKAEAERQRLEAEIVRLRKALELPMGNGGR